MNALRCLPLHVVGAVGGHGAAASVEAYACTADGDACVAGCVYVSA
jgi:hypothetical protein